MPIREHPDVSIFDSMGIRLITRAGAYLRTQNKDWPVWILATVQFVLCRFRILSICRLISFCDSTAQTICKQRSKHKTIILWTLGNKQLRMFRSCYLAGKRMILKISISHDLVCALQVIKWTVLLTICWYENFMRIVSKNAMRKV